MSRTFHHRKTEDWEHYHHWRWWEREPRWWRKANKHKKRRAEARLAVHRYMDGDEEVVFPLDKKPWIYYW